MSQLLNKRYNLVRINGIHKDKIYNERKTAKKIYSECINHLKTVENKPYFKHRRLSKDKMRKTIEFEVKPYVDELLYVIEHHRYTNASKKDAKKRLNWIKDRIDFMVNPGIEY